MQEKLGPIGEALKKQILMYVSKKPCPPCDEALPQVEALSREFGVRLHVIAVDPATAPTPGLPAAIYMGITYIGAKMATRLRLGLSASIHPENVEILHACRRD